MSPKQPAKLRVVTFASTKGSDGRHWRALGEALQDGHVFALEVGH
jgi:hypothetical protein